MRTLRLAGQKVMCGTLFSAMRWQLTEKEDELLWDSLRAILRRHGALPLSRASSMLSDEVLESMSNLKGGLRQYVQDRPSRFQTEVLPSGVTVVMLASELRRAGGSAPLVGKVLAVVATAPQQQMHVSHVFRALSPVEQRKCGNDRLLESFLLQHPSLLIVHNGVVRPAPTSFMALKGVSASSTSRSQTISQQMSASSAAPSCMPVSGDGPVVCETLPEAPMPLAPHSTGCSDPKLNKLLLLLQRAVPFSFYVPLHVVAAGMRHRLAIFSPEAKQSEIIEELQRVPGTILDCRVIGDEKEDVFLRMMDAERRPYIGDESSIAQGFEVLPLGPPLIKAFRKYGSISGENRQRLRNGVSMRELGDILPPNLIEQLRIYGPNQKDTAFILIFDRLRNLFDVNMSACMVRPWDVMQEHEQPSSLTWQTTPVPTVLRHTLEILRDKPIAPDALTTALPTYAQKQLQWAYSSVAEFVSHHSLYLLMKDDLVWTPYLAAASQGARVPSATRGGHAAGRHLKDTVKARMLMEIMPKHHAVVWSRFRTTPAVRELPFDVRDIRQDFFDRHRDCFAVYEVLGSTTLIVGRRDGTPPPGNLLQPPCRSLADLIRLIALWTVGGAQEATVLNYLSKDARTMVRRYGSVVQIVQQLPMWFEVRGERQGAGSAIISYIGPGSTRGHE
ncbi:hypothetical protein ERJ75_000241100 [Trypanosoma vivax]|uniref:DUF7883 domain-containing protein n=1 Tax=Trypanosoma vivax (strain Y486) TaxID=1055687 RepID=G0TY23_TRYVY|nr:hypothetical protein TRVL_01667 [Trypanosoma vivax]KAH8618676.1 hypothetical protein ERJ75_000241100 [Trypanosoma vivax]CCC48868.1 conserved hypothetical protein [Trypanosoma vivax Y486]